MTTQTCHLVSIAQTCLLCEPASCTRSAEPLRACVLQMAGKQLSLPKRHTLDAGTAASTFRLHCITSLPANRHLPKLSTHSPLCHRLCLLSLSAPGACCMLCVQDLLGCSDMREVAEAESWPSEPQAQQPLLSGPPRHTHDANITGMQYSACLGPSQLG